MKLNYGFHLLCVIKLEVFSRTKFCFFFRSKKPTIIAYPFIWVSVLYVAGRGPGGHNSVGSMGVACDAPRRQREDGCTGRVASCSPRALRVHHAAEDTGSGRVLTTIGINSSVCTVHVRRWICGCTGVI